MNLHRFATADEFLSSTLKLLLELIQGRKNCHVALSGGSTPKPIYEALAKEPDINWSQVHLFQVDERYVPENHLDSNRHLIETSLVHQLHTLGSWHFFDTKLSIEGALETYETEIRTQQPFDLCILGLGPDGHTASLFPHSPTLTKTTRLVAHTTTDHFAVRDRLTLTFPAIMASSHLLLLLQGKEKEPVLQDLLHSNKSINELPAKKLLEHPSLTIHYYSPIS